MLSLANLLLGLPAHLNQDIAHWLIEGLDSLPSGTESSSFPHQLTNRSNRPALQMQEFLGLVASYSDPLPHGVDTITSGEILQKHIPFSHDINYQLRPQTNKATISDACATLITKRAILCPFTRRERMLGDSSKINLSVLV